MTADDELMIKIEADFSSLQKGLKQAKSQLGGIAANSQSTASKFDKSMDKMERSTASLVSQLDKAKIATAAFAAALGVFSAKQIQSARETDLWAKRLDVSTQKFSQLAAVGRKFGADLDTVGDAIKDLNERIADASAGNKNYEDSLGKIGLKSSELINLPVEEQFLKVADAIGKMNNAGARNFVTAELMADAGFRLIPAFQAGETAIRGMMSAAAESGEAFSADDVKKFEEMDKVLRDLESSSKALGNAVFTLMTPALKAIAEWSNAAAEALVAFDNAANPGKTKIDKNIDFLSESINKYKEELKELIGVTKDGKLDLENEFWGDNNQAKIDETREKINTLTDALASLRRKQRGEEEDTTSADKLVKSEATEDPTDLDELIIEGQIALTERQEQILRDHNSVMADLEDDANSTKLGLMNEQGQVFNKFLLDQEKAEKAHQNRMTAMWTSGFKGRMQIAGGIMSSMSVLMESENRKMFETGKAAAKANAVIETIAAAQKSFSAMAGIPIVGPTLGAAAAGAALVAGYARVSKIQSTTMGGASAGGGGGSVGGGVSLAAASAPTGEAGAAGEAAQVTNFDITLGGQDQSNESIRSLISQINDNVDDNVNLRARS